MTETLSLLRRLVRENVRVSLELGPGDLEVVGDRGQLEQVVTNLVLNAVDAMPDGGTVVVRSGADADEAWLEVADSGLGMSGETLSRAFEPFFTTKDTGRGTGLGLAVVHGVVSQHGGRVEVESAPGRGSRFRVSLPRGRAGKKPGRAEGGSWRASATGRGERVLVVEDAETIRTLLRRLLDGLGYRVTVVESGEAALALPAEPSFDLVLSDVMLPGISGIEAARSLHQRWPGVRIILMSGYAKEQVLHEDLPDGVVRFLAKPAPAATIAREVRACLDAHPGAAETP